MEENKGYDFSKLWEIIKRNLKWLIILPIVCLLLSVLVTAVAVHPKYQATSQVIINKSDKGDLTMAEKFQADSQIVATYTDIAKSPRVLGKVADKVGNGETANSISEKVEISNEPNSQVLNFTATDQDKKQAEDKKEALKSALEGQDLEDIKTKKEELEKVVQELSMKVYQQAQQAQQEDANGSNQSDVEDAEYTEVKDDDDKKDNK